MKNEKQLTYYDSGIGTYARPSWRSYVYVKQVVSNMIDLAIAWYFINMMGLPIADVVTRKLEKIIIGAYRWLANHYKSGDIVYLFGVLSLTVTFAHLTYLLKVSLEGLTRSEPLQG